MAKVLFILIPLFQTTCTYYTPLNNAVEVVDSVQRIFKSGCIFLLFSKEESESLDGEQYVFSLKKILAKRNIRTAATNVVSLNIDSKDYQCTDNIPMYVMLSSSNSTKERLKQVSRSSQMNAAVWLLLVEYHSDLENVFRDIYVPFNCEFLVAQNGFDEVILTEVFRIGSTLPLQTYTFGRWTRAHGFSWSPLKFYERRNNLEGIVLRAGYKYGDGIHKEEIRKAIDRRNGVKFYFSEVWLLLEEMLNFTTEYYRPADNAWGGLLKNGSWNGMMGMILRNEVDVAVDAYLITSARISIVDYMTTLLPTTSRIFIRQPDTIMYHWTDFLKPFSIKLWMYLVLSIFVLAFLLSRLFNMGQFSNSMDHRQALSYGLLDCINYILASFCQQGQSSVPASLSCRIIIITSYLMAVVILSAYSASLISHLTNQNVVLPFNTFKELLKVGSYKLGVIDKSAQLNYFDNATDRILRKLYKSLIKPHLRDLPVTEANGLRRICQEMNYAFMTPFDTPLSRYNNFKCKMVEITGASIPGSLTMPMSKYHPFLGLINYTLENMRRNGMLNRLHSMAWPRRLRDFIIPWKSVNKEEVTPIFALLSSGFVIAIIIFFLEVFVKYLRICVQTRQIHRTGMKRKAHFVYV